MGAVGRIAALVRKEARQLGRDRPTFALTFGMPILQLLLFGFAIDNDPRGLPAGILVADPGRIARAVAAAAETTGYLRWIDGIASEAEADRALRRGRAQVVLTLPSDLERRLVRGEPVQILLEADATDPTAVANAVTALRSAVEQTLARELDGPLAARAGRPASVELLVHRRWNEEAITRHNVVPGLLSVVLTMTMVMMTALAVTRERERGTLEGLLALPVRPVEVMAGKILPFLVIGAIQVTVVLAAARLLFAVPIEGSLALLALGTLLFVAVNLGIGFTLSTIATSQLQAMQLSFFFLLPSILLSGFAFPFRGMPGWAQAVGEALPATHYLRIVRGLMLKGAGLEDVAAELLALGLLLLLTGALALARWRPTLD